MPPHGAAPPDWPYLLQPTTYAFRFLCEFRSRFVTSATPLHCGDLPLQMSWMGGAGLGARSTGARTAQQGADGKSERAAATGQGGETAGLPSGFEQRAAGLFASLGEREPCSKPVLPSPILDIAPESNSPASWVVSAAVGAGKRSASTKRVRRTHPVARDEDGVSDPGADDDDDEEEDDDVVDEDGVCAGVTPMARPGGARKEAAPDKAMEVLDGNAYDRKCDARAKSSKKVSFTGIAASALSSIRPTAPAVSKPAMPPTAHPPPAAAASDLRRLSSRRTVIRAL